MTTSMHIRLLALLVSAATSTLLGALKMENRSLCIQFGEKNDAIVAEMSDKKTGRNYVAASRIPFYTLVLVDKDNQKTIVNSTAASRAVFVRTRPDEISITFTHTLPPLIATARVCLGHDDLSYWKLDVKNNTDNAVVEVDFPAVPLRQSFGEQPGNTRVIFPSAMNDMLYRDLPRVIRYLRQHDRFYFNARFDQKKSDGYPFSIDKESAPDVVQMTAAYDELAGVYIATHDPNAHVKELFLEAVDAEGFRIKINHVRSRAFGADFNMGYDTVIGVFHGDWTTAADIYKSWATNQKWCSKGRLAERRDIPGWIKKQPVYLRYGIQHPKYDGKKTWMKFAPWNEIPGFVADFEYQDVISNAIIHLYEFDPGGEWQAYYNKRWPPWMGDDAFFGFTGRVRSEGKHPCIQPWGWWVQAKDPFVPDYRLEKEPYWPEYWEKYAVRKEHEIGMTSAPAQSTWGPPHACLAGEYGRNVFLDDVKRTASRGIDYFQIMEIGLVQRMHCFNADHSHPLGRGQWIYETAHEVFQKVRDAGRKVNPNFCLDKEDSAEYLIDVADSFMIRNSEFKEYNYIGFDEVEDNHIALFDYLYHEYIPLLDGFQGWDPVSFRYQAAKAVVLGHITGPLFGGYPGNFAYDHAKAGGAWEIVRKGQRLKAGIGERYLIFGKTLPQPQANAGTMKLAQMKLKMPKGNPNSVMVTPSVPRILTSAHLSSDGRSVGCCFINASDASCDFQFNPSVYLKTFGLTAAAADMYADASKEKAINLVHNNTLALSLKPLDVIFIVIHK